VGKNVVEVKVVHADSPAVEQEIIEWLRENSEADLRVIAVYKSPKLGGKDAASQKIDRFLQELELLQ
jgi:hypothetical protein